MTDGPKLHYLVMKNELQPAPEFYWNRREIETHLRSIVVTVLYVNRILFLFFSNIYTSCT